MASLGIEVKLAKGAHSPFATVDGTIVPLNAQGEGSVQVSGSCGDGSRHQLLTSMQGPVGATMAVVVSCAGATVCEIKAMTVTAAREPFAGTHRSFTI